MNRVNRKPKNYSVMKRLFLLVLCWSGSVMAGNVDAEIQSLIAKSEVLKTRFSEDVSAIVADAEQRKQSSAFQVTASALNHMPRSTADQREQPKIPRVLVFVSFSMPPASLKSWLQQANKVNGAVVLRGLVNNSFKDTSAALMPLLKEQGSGFLLDPTLFTRYHIEAVPAVVIQDDAQCRLQASCVPHYAVFYGNTTLAYALGQIAHSDHTLASAAANAILILEGKGGD